MPKYKMLRGVAHNLGHSFLSLMNYLKFDYCLDYLFAISRVKKINKVYIDFLKCRLKPKHFDIRELICSAYEYKRRFSNDILDLKIDPVEIKSVIMKITLDNKQNKITKSHKIKANVVWEVSIKLKNNKEYKKAMKTDWLLDSDKNYKKLYDKITK